MRAKNFLGLAAMFAFGCAGGIGSDGDESSQALTRCSDHGQVVYGVDVSGYQGSSIDWGAVRAAGRVFAFAKSTEGTGFVDSSFAHNWPGMRSAGVIRGAYHFFRPGSDGVAQADLMLSVIDAHGGLAAGDLSPVVDVEVGDNQSAGTVIYQLHRFIDRVAQRTGRTPIIYTANFFWGDTMGNPHFDNPLWVANYGPSCPYLPNAFSDWRFWQNSDHDRVNGIPGGVDGDMFNGTLAELHAFAGGGGGGVTKTGGDSFGTSRRVAQNRDGRLELFARAVDNGVWHDWQGAPSGTFSGWSSLGGQTVSDPVVAADADGRLEAFVIVGGHLFHTFQLTGGGWYNGWLDEGDGNLAGEPALVMNSNGCLEVFARAANGQLEHKWQDAPNGGWSGWASLGGLVHSDPGVARNSDGRVEVFALGSDDRLFHIWQTAPHGGWSGFSGFGGLTLRGAPRPGANADGRLEVFVVGTDGRLHHLVQLPGGGWSGLLDAGTATVSGEPAVGRNADGRLEVFARGTDDALYHLWQTAPNGGWTGTEAFGGTRLTSTPDVAPNANGNLQVFWRGTDGSIETVFQQSGAGWSAVVSLGGNLASF